MKRYRVLTLDFDARAALLDLKIETTWDPKVQELHRANKEQIKRGLIADFGQMGSVEKIKNFTDLGPAPVSVVAYHNRFFWQVRCAFVMFAYYPALTGACALGERILNHVLLKLRDSFKKTREYKKVYAKSSFDNWDVVIETLEAWEVFSPTVSKLYRELKHIRNHALHFRPETDHNDRELALNAIRKLGKIIQLQFGAFGRSDIFIEDTPGVAFLKKSVEALPFIQTYYLPNCAHVGPNHRLDHREGRFFVTEDPACGAKEFTDKEFAIMFNTKKPQ